MAKRRKSTRGRVLVSPTGRKYTKNIDAYIDKINNDPNLTKGEKLAKITDLKIYIEDRAKQARNGLGKRLTTNGFEAWEADSDLERMFASLGMSAADIADEYDLDESELLDPNNWNKGVFMGKYKFEHTYTGAIFEEI